MAGQRPFNINPTGLNLFPFLGNPLANTQQFLTQLQDLRMPQPNNNQGLYGQDSYGRQKMQFTGDLYNREPLDLNDHGERSFRELYSRSRRSRSQERENFTSESQDRIQGLMDREIPLDFLFPEMGSHKGEERYGREELERQHYGSYKSRSRSPVRPKAEPKDRELSPSDKKYGARNDAAVPWNALLRQHCYLVPPLDDTYVLALSEKQPGCCAIFIGGLPSMADEDIIREIFSVCGPIEQISVNVRANAQVKHCQLRFVKHDSVERAVKFNGHVLVIGDGRDRKTKIGRIRVDYDKLPNDNKQMNVDMAVNQQQPQNKKGTDLSLVYTRKQAFHLLDLIRHDQAITESLGTLTHWLEKGECNRSTVNVFHTLLNTIHSLIRRLINKRKEHEQRVEKQKQLAVERANEIKQQCEAVWKVFEAATKQKSWDHFTKAQRKNISQWHGAVKKEIKSAKEAEIQNRVEVGMDLDDEVPSLGGLIEQPALQIEEEGQKQEQGQDQASLSPSKAKKRRVETSESDADTTDSLKLENKKLRTQVESLKAIAEQNTSLMWSMQSYQHQAEDISQQYSNMIAAKDYEIFCLKKALQGANILTDPQRAMNELEIVVDLSNRNQTVTGMDLETEELTQSHEGSKENSKEGIQEVMKQDDGVEVHEESTQNVGNENLVDSGGRRQSDAVCPELGDVSNSEKLCLQSQPGQEVTLKEGDVEHEGVPFERESIEIDRGKKWFEEGTKDEEMHNEGRQTDDKETNQAEEEVKLEEKDETSAEDEENHAEDRQTQTEREEKESEEEKEKDVKEKSAAEKESGRFVEIDDEQFEVIDDMDEEESDDDYNEITVASLVHENDEVNAQLASNLSGYQPDYSDCKTQDSEVTIHVSNYQVNEQLASDSSVHQPGDSTHKTQGSEVAVCVNSDQVNEELASDSASFAEPDNVTRKKTQDSDDHYNEVTMIDQLPANSSNYQSNYDAQYQAWLSTAVTSHASMDYGPAQVRISGEELVLVGIMCSYLQLCPSGATSGEIRDYLSRQFKERRKDVVERLLYSLPVLFKAEDASGNAKWKFCGFGNLAEAKGERKQ